MARVTSEVFVGRRQEVERIERAIAAARAGTPSILFVAGEAGVGKTRLIDELSRRARAGGSYVLIGGCVDLGGEPLPFAPIVEAIRRLRRELPPETVEAVLGSARAELARLVPELGGARDEPAGIVYASTQSRLFELLLGVLVRLAERDAPLLVIIEDIHWADRSTLDLLAFLIRNLYGGVVLVATYRTDELHRRHPLLPFLAEAARSGRTDRLELAPFDRAESIEQLAGILGHAPGHELAERVFERSGGNAFFAEELLASDLEGDALPETLRDVLLARIGDLSESAQEVLRAAAAAGREVSVALLGAILELPERELGEALREAVAHQILVPDESGPDERYRFRHALLQEAIYSELLPGERTRLHITCAEVLSADPRVAVDAALSADLARHWYSAHAVSKALAASVRAGVAAEAAFAFAEALAQYERALELLPQVPDTARELPFDHAGLLERAAEASYLAGRPRAVGYIRSAIALVDERADPVRAGLFYERLGRFDYADGNGQAALVAYRRAVELVPPAPPSAARARTLAGLGQILMLTGEYAESEVACREAISIARAVGAQVIESHALNTLGVVRACVGDVEEGVRDLERSAEIASAARSYEDFFRSLGNLADTLNSSGRAVEGEAVARRALEEHHRLGFVRFAGAQAAVDLAGALYWQGRWDEALEATRHADTYVTRDVSRIALLGAQLHVYIGRGEVATARAALADLKRHAARAVDPQYLQLVSTLSADLDLLESHPEAALAEVCALEARLAMDRLFIGLTARLYWTGVRAAAEVALAAGTPGRETDPALIETATRLRDGMRLAAEVARRGDHARLGAMHEALTEGEFGRLTSRPDPAAWRLAAELAAVVGPRSIEGYARWRLAESLLAGHGDRTEAGAALRAAYDIAGSLRAAPLLRDVEELGRRGRLDLTVEPAPDDGAVPAEREAERLGLTVRELEVLRLVAGGRTNREIGEALFISESTAGVHVSNILGKLGVRSRREAAAVARRLGLLEPVTA